MSKELQTDPELTLSEKLQTDPELTLEKAKMRIPQKAAAKEHRRELQGDKEATLNRLRRGSGLRTSKWKQGGTSGTSLSDNRLRYNRGGANKSVSHIVRGVVVTSISLEIGVQLWE